MNNLGAKIGGAVGGIIGLAGAIAPIFTSGEIEAPDTTTSKKEPSIYFKAIEPGIKSGWFAGIGFLTGAFLGEIVETAVRAITKSQSSNNP